MRPTNANPVHSALAAATSVLVASSCCLPLGTFWLAAGVAGASSFLNSARPYLMAASVALIAFGFYQARKARQCNRPPNLLNAALLWSSALFVGVSLFFPQAFASLIAGRSVVAPSGQVALSSFNLKAFEEQFDAASGPKVVVLLSPT